MKIILEGADGTGKTTLANILAEKYGLTVCHCTQHDPSDFYFYKETFRKENTVWDRHTIGELIYPQVFGRDPQISKVEAQVLIELAKEADVKILVLTCEDKVLKRRLAERKDEHHLIAKSIEWINKSFCDAAKAMNVPLIDTSKMTLQEIFDLVEEKGKH